MNYCPVCKKLTTPALSLNKNFYCLIYKKLGWKYYCQNCNIFNDDELRYSKFFIVNGYQIVHRKTYINIIKHEDIKNLMYGKNIMNLSIDKSYIFNLSEERFLKFMKMFELLQ